MNPRARTPTRKAAGPRLLAVLAWLWLVVATPFLTDAACNWVLGLLLAGSWLLLGAGWLGLPLVSPASLSSRPGKLWYVAAALAGCLGLVLAVTDVGLAVRVAACEPSLTAYAEGVPPDTHEVLHDPRSVGLFQVDGTEEHDGVVLLYTGWDFLNRRGVAYVPPGKSPPPRVRFSRHLYGRWYSFMWRF